MSARWITADVFDGLATLEDGSVDLVVSSPPFLALRSYLPADHPDKGKEIGSEPTPAAFLDVMLAVTAELRRVLAPHGSIAIELGDTYAGSSQEQREDVAIGSARWGGQNGQPTLTGARGGTVDRKGEGWPLAKSKALIPELYRIALAYGINPLTGQESPAGRWRVRNNVTWCRPNPPVGALGDKWRPATSDVVVACVSDKRYWDDIATRRIVDAQSPRWTNGPKSNNATQEIQSKWEVRVDSNPAGAPLLDYWEIPPGGYPGSHYAVFPPALVEPLIKAMAPPKVCRQCGEPSRRIVGDITLDSYRSSDRTQTKRAVALADEHGLTDAHIAAVRAFGTSDAGKAQQINNGAGKNTDEVKRLAGEAKAVLGGYFREFVMNTNAERATTGWSDCGHDDWRPALILDCFGGSGTTGAVATGHGHDAVLIDLDDRNAELARERIGPMLFDGPHHVTSRDDAHSDAPPDLEPQGSPVGRPEGRG